MALITMNTTDEGKAFRQLETVAILNQTAASTAVTKGVSVPWWARSVSFYLTVSTVTGTTPKLDFVLEQADYSTSPPTAMATPLGIGNGWDGITQITAAAQVNLVTIDVGPDIATDDTGSATASCYYAVNTYLPPVVVYKYTTQDAADDADYNFTITCLFRP